MNNVGDKNNFFKNPIGVIGIFLVLVEAIASTVIVKSNLNDAQNMILILFVVLFPCIVLFVFYKLVTQHHEKLYSPSDYKNEENFLSTYNRSTQNDEIKRVGNNEDSANKQNEIEGNMLLIREALSNIMEMQKKIIPTMETSVLTEDEKEQYVTYMEDYLTEKENDLKVEVSPMYKSTKLVEELVNQGYSANIYVSDFNNKKVVPNVEHEAIWVGSEVPVEMVTDVLKIAKNYYPHLKYIELNDCKHGAPEYVKYEIYIGGATSTAKSRGLKSWMKEDFEKLFGITEKEALHDFIKKFE